MSTRPKTGKKRKKSKDLSSSKILIPSSIFCNRSVAVLESICLFLKDELNYKYREISFLLNRDERTIWTAYNRAIKKNKNYPKPDTIIHIPIQIFQDRRLSVLEAIVVYLKDSLSLTHHKIAVLLSRDDRTIWTCYSRAKKKL